jgi:hypothetical protein
VVAITTSAPASASIGRSGPTLSSPLTRQPIGSGASPSARRRARSSSPRAKRRYRSIAAVRAPTITASTCVRSAWKSSRSAAPPIPTVLPPSVARPSAVATMLTTR